MLSLPSTMTLLAPLVHSELTLGVDAKFRRVRYIIDGRPVDVPVLSGNSIRGLLRRAAARTTLELCEVAPESLGVRSFDLVFSGGAIDHGAKAGTAIPIDELRRARESFPPLHLFGGSVGAHVIPGCVDVDMATPITRELEPYTEIASDLSIWDCLQEVPYTHHDDRRDRDEKSRTQMRYSVECLAAGVQLAHGARLYTDDPILIGCFWDAVDRVARERPLGGRGAIGHGRFTWTWQPDRDLIDRYREHLVEIAPRVREFLGVQEPASVR
jgi:hypothetical protein